MIIGSSHFVGGAGINQSNWFVIRLGGGARILFCRTFIESYIYLQKHIFINWNEKERNGKYYKRCKLSSDRRGARPGGNFLEENGNIIRVAQNCEDYYGQGLVFLKVDQIEPIYKEHEIRQMNPAEIEVVNGGSYLGIHTYNRLEDMEVIDLMYQEYSEEEALAQKRVREVFCDKFR